MPQHVVVDGSNLATEGRSQPSLAQLNEAVLAYIADHPDTLITVVVDATFGHRIDPKEVAEFEEGINNNELVAPPAGAVGRGDAFVLSIADKVNATIISNDSYQEFHGQYPWLFDEGRLVGGKPVPHVGWVFVNRIPVRGPTSRKSVAAGKRKSAAVIGSPDADQPMPVPKAPPPRKAVAAPVVEPVSKRQTASKPSANDVASFLAFVERHPVGTSVNAIVDHYSSHGAYVRIEDKITGYVPLRLMADPAPRSAREFMKRGESVTLVVDSFRPATRGVDLAVPGMETHAAAEPKPKTSRPPTPKKAPRKATKKAPAKAPAKPAESVADKPTAKKPAGALAKLGLRRRRAAD